MWEKYAGNHTGVCIELHCTQAPPGCYAQVDFFGQLFAVNYSDVPPAVNFYRFWPPEETVKATVLTKGMKWAHEKEWRFVDMRKGPHVDTLPAGLMTAVILGHRISPEDRDLVKDLAARHDPPLEVFQAVLSAQTTRIQVRKLVSRAPGCESL
jgi:hypothetical protein